MARNRKRRGLGLAVLAAALLMLVVLGAVLVFAFPAEQVGRVAAERASAALDRDIEVGRVRLKLWPAPAVALEDVSIARWRNSGDAAAAARDTARPLAEIGRIELRPRLLPLLRREAIIHAIVIDRPALFIEVDGAADPVPEGVRDEAAGFWDNSTVQIERFAIRDGSVAYHDLVTGDSARVDGIDQELSLRAEMREGELARLALTGQISAESVNGRMPERLAVPLRDVSLAIEHDAVLDMTNQHAALQRIALTLQEMTLEGSGTLDAWSDPERRRLSLQLSTGDTELDPLLASLPASMRSWPQNAAAGQEWTAAAGSARIEATVDGRLGGGEVPTVDGSLTLSGIALSRGGEPVVTDLAGTVEFANTRVSTEGLTGQLLGAPLLLSLSAEDLAAPVIDLALDTRVDLARATALGLLPEGWRAAGAPDIDLTVAGPVQQPTSLVANGQIALSGLTLEAPEWPAPLSVSTGTVEFGGPELVGRGLAATIGTSDVTLDFAAVDWLPFALGETDPAPRFVLESRSNLLDIDALFPFDPAEPTYGQLFFARLANTQVNGQSATEAAESAGMKLPELPRIFLDGRLEADRIVQRGTEFRDVRLQFGAADGALEIRSADLRMLQGAMQVAARLGPKASEGPGAGKAPLAIQFEVDEVEAASFLERYTAFRDHVSGALRVAGTMAMALDEQLLPEPATVTGSGELTVTGGEVVNWSLVRSLGERLGVARFDTVNFDDWTGRFQMAGSRIMLTETTLQSGDLSASIGGSFDVSGQLDLAGTVYLGPGLTARVGEPSVTRFLAAAGDGQGRVPVGVRISGSSQAANVSLDLSEAGRMLADRAREAAEAEARERVREAAGQLVGSTSLPAVESPAAAVDSVRQRVGDAVVGRLRGLLGGRAAPGDAAPEPTPEAAPADSAAAPEAADGDGTPAPEDAPQ